jgi:hypothetical protein
MRALPVGPLPLALSLTVLLASCAAAPSMGPGGPFAPPSPQPGLFVSPFGEVFSAEPGEPWPSADWFVGADRNLDGAIDFEEFTADGQRWFAALDADRDGRLNQSELLAHEASLRNIEMGGPGANGGPPVGVGLGEKLRPSGPRRGAPRARDGQAQYGVIADAGYFNLPRPVKSADVNIDQRLTAEEWAAATQRWFLALDTDRDGRLTQATLPQTPLQRRHAR